MTRTETLHAAEKAVNGDRQGDYGTPENNFKNIAGFWSLYLSSKLNKEIELQAVDVAVLLDLMKTARLIQSPRKLDTWIDKAGYAACGAEIVSETKGKETLGGLSGGFSELLTTYGHEPPLWDKATTDAITTTP